MIATISSALAFEAAQSTISGVTNGDTLIINQTYTLTVQAKDAGGNNLVSGGEILYAYISDPCTRGANMACVPSVFTQSATNGGELIQRFTDNADGTYTTSFDLNHIGDATLSVLQITSEPVLNEYYSNYVISGTPDVTNTSASINFNFGFGDIIPGYPDAAARFTAKITPFQTGTSTLTLHHDDGSDLRINGVQFVSRFGEQTFRLDTLSYNFNAFETYDVEIDWADYALAGELYFKWDFGSGTQLIPSDNYAVSNDVGSSPLQISVSCPVKYEQKPSTTDQCQPKCGDGFVIASEACDDGNATDGDGCKSDCTAVEASWVCSGGSMTTQSVCTECTQGFYQNNPSNPTACVTQCGDGYRVGAEVCDDNNINDGDGCTSDCSEIEANYACSRGSSNSKDTCELCVTGFTPGSNKEACIPVCGDGIFIGSETCDDGNTIKDDGCAANCSQVEVGWKCNKASPTVCTRDYKSIPLTDKEEVIRFSTIGVISISVILNTIGKRLNQSSRNSILSSINQLQLLILLLLLGIYLPTSVINYLRSLSSSLININIDWSSLIGFRTVSDWFDYPQDRDDFDMVDISSGSTVINLSALVFTFVVLLIMHIIVAIFLSCNKESQKCFAKVARYIKKCLTYELYFVLIFESFITMCLCSSSEFGSFRLSNTNTERLSFAFSVIFSLAILAIIISVGFIWIYTESEEPEAENLFTECLFSGLRPTKAARLQLLLFLIRRAVLCLMIVLLRDRDRPVFLGFYLGVNCIHCVIVCIIRPFEKVTDNITEIMNELFYVSFCLFLQWHYLEDQWSYTKGVVYYWCLVSNNIINALLSIIFFLFKLFTRRYARKPIKILAQNPATSHKIFPSRTDLRCSDPKR